MQPNHYDLFGQARDEPRNVGRMTRDVHQPPRDNTVPSRSPSGVAPTRSEDSWIEVASQPSSSSLSSANDDIITTGLRVESSSYQQRSRRRRMQRHATVSTAQVDYSSRENSSSQDEYEESESESDRVLSSSNEEMARQPLGGPLLARAVPPASSSDAPSSDEDDSSTALGMRISSSPFVPQPNVFSHPPVSQDPSWTRPTEAHRSEPSTVSNSSRRTAIRRNSYASMRPTQRQPQSQQHSPYNMISPSHHADHDAALRASLSTLLSCAAAARGLPKQETRQSPAGPSRGQPSSFRLVPESVAMGEESGEEESASAAETPASAGRQRSRKHSQPTNTYPPHIAQPAKGKRRSSSPKDRSSVSKKSRRTSMAESASAASPTIMTWVISAGVVVIFSAISFSAGYMLGREVGRTEMGTGMGMVGDGGYTSGRASAACGQEAVKGGLKRLRWGSAASASGIIA